MSRSSTVDRPADRSNDRPPRMPLIIVLIGGFIAFLDFFVVNVAVPSIQNGLDAGASETQLVMVGYGAALCVGLITGGRMGDLFGPRRMFLIGLALFTVASTACGFAPGIRPLIAARVVQGLSSALLAPQVLAIVSHLYTGEARNRAFGAYGLMLGLSGLCGQLIGGALIALDVAGLGWRTVFLVNIPIGLVILALTPRIVPDIRSVPATRAGADTRAEAGANARAGVSTPAEADTRTRAETEVGADTRAVAGAKLLDLPGVALGTAGLSAAVWPLLEGREQGWPLWTWISLVAALPLFILFIARQRRLAALGGSPLIEPGLFRERGFAVGVIAYFVYFMSMGSFFLLFAIYLQEGRGWGPLPSGLLFTTMSAGFFGSSFLAGRIAARTGRHVIAMGAGLVAIGYGTVGLVVAQLGVDGEAGWVAPGLLVAGSGMGLVASPLPAAAMAGVAPARASSASGVLSTAMEGGTALGVSLVGLVFFGALGNAPEAADYPRAFCLGIAVIVVFPVLVALLVQALPAPAPAATEQDGR
ncbi:MFS transporter [Streptomyces sp. NPDC014734]|uniref:MFS transporter n=1 Tax=Streptomyces sp. NPDC014734 TaxID=3364886 RepID=UPI003700AE55